ncbi:protein FAR1-RELATED SEQUENCE 5-like [Salvia divinorum]|uniref:Protein FAR1-RELATED SEQUENCE 5-like n=1 Tax=Salvia divinorum TaxID=28513 RepID=A0ABD1GPT2_SALDI
MVIPDCKDGLKPVVGKLFKSLQDARLYYDVYARDAGFETRKFSHKASHDVVTWLYVVCSREGVKRTQDLDAVNAQEGFANRRRRGSKRCRCNAKITFKFVSECGKKESCPSFHYVFEVDSNDKLTRYRMIFGPFTVAIPLTSTMKLELSKYPSNILDHDG